MEVLFSFGKVRYNYVSQKYICKCAGTNEQILFIDAPDTEYEIK